jgi:membrane protein YdbS with pleckstrin-like domain
MSSETEDDPEKVLWSGACSHWHYFGHWIFGLLLVAASGAGLYFYKEELTPWMPWAYLAPVALLLLVISIVAWKRALHRYQITPGRVVVQTGRFVRDSNEIRTQDIRSINVTKNGMGGLIGIGTVEFSSAATDDAEVTFVGIAGADAVRDMVRKLQSTEAPVKTAS